ncbi:MAG: peptide-methionine (S)-S-oxide reductase MsrA [Rhodomicrobium sp.]|nr:peptide-methionine (S)-S-oxide reductase MsrA [Rhodomicrobium sp.]
MRILAALAIIAALTAGAASAQTATAIFAGGCFWCMEPPFDKTDGVISTTSGYAGGEKTDPTYEEVSAGGTGHIETVKIEYDPAKVSYEKLLDIYWRNVDPFDASGQFCDKGQHYRSAIFYGNETEKALAEASKKRVAEKFGKAVETLILPASKFYPAEDYHQDYYQKNPLHYKFYRYGCGRDARLEAVWGKSG